jgi:hypothetical protein
MWKHRLAGSALVLNTVRKPRSAKPLSRAIAAARRTISPTSRIVAGRARSSDVDVRLGMTSACSGACGLMS